MWGNTGNYLAVLEALPQIRADASLWPKIIPPLSNSFADSTGKNWDKYGVVLDELRVKLASEKSLSLVLMNLASFDDENAKGYLEEVISRNEHPFSVQKAKARLYELEHLQEGKPAPIFTATSTSGETIDFESFRGQVVLLEFWSTNCGPCMPDIPKIKSLFDRYDEELLKVIGIAVNDKEEDLDSFLDDREMHWTQIMQSSKFEEGVLSMDDVLQKYNVFGIPRSIIVDRDGKIVAIDLRGDALVEAVENEIAG